MGPGRFDSCASLTAVKVAVVGAGVLGAMTAWRLAHRGADVVLYDRFGPATDRGSSHGRSRIFRRALFEGVAYVPLIERSAVLFEELADVDPTARMRVTGGLTIGPGSGGIVAAAMEAAKVGNVEVEVLDHDELRRRFPQHLLLADDMAMFEPGAGVVPAEPAVRAAVDAAHAQGATVRVGSRVIAVEPLAEGVAIETESERDHADAVVLAAGAELGSLVPDLALPLEIEQSMHVWFDAVGDSRWGAEEFPVFVRESGRLRGWGLGDLGDGLVKIGLSSAKPPVADLDAYIQGPPVLGAVETDPVGDYVRAALHGLDPSPMTATPCLNTFTPDGDFILGRHPAVSRIVLVGAGSGHSFKHAPAVGEVAAELALGLEPSLPIEAFDPARFTA
jgi:sarcosine oxidase